MKYEEGVKNRLEELGNKEKEIKRNGKSGKSELGVQIAKLEGVIVKAEADVEIAEEEYEASKFSMPFSLKDVDDADYKLEKAKKALSGHKSDLKNRKTLLKELF